MGARASADVGLVQMQTNPNPEKRHCSIHAWLISIQQVALSFCNTPSVSPWSLLATSSDILVNTHTCKSVVKPHRVWMDEARVVTATYIEAEAVDASCTGVHASGNTVDFRNLNAT